MTSNDDEEIHKERRFLIERTYQFINFGVVTLGFGLAAAFSDHAAPFRPMIAWIIAFLFAGATILGIFSWITYTAIVKPYQNSMSKTTFKAPSYWWLFFSGICFGIIGIAIFAYIALC